MEHDPQKAALFPGGLYYEIQRLGEQTDEVLKPGARQRLERIEEHYLADPMKPPKFKRRSRLLLDVVGVQGGVGVVVDRLSHSDSNLAAPVGILTTILLLDGIDAIVQHRREVRGFVDPRMQIIREAQGKLTTPVLVENTGIDGQALA